MGVIEQLKQARYVAETKQDFSQLDVFLCELENCRDRYQYLLRCSGLPVVTEETGKSLAHTVDEEERELERDSFRFARKLCCELEISNPCIVNFLGNMVTNFEHRIASENRNINIRDVACQIIMTGCLMYRLLEKQLQANQMNSNDQEPRGS